MRHKGIVLNRASAEKLATARSRFRSRCCCLRFSSAPFLFEIRDGVAAEADEETEVWVGDTTTPPPPPQKSRLPEVAS